MWLTSFSSILPPSSHPIHPYPIACCCAFGWDGSFVTAIDARSLQLFFSFLLSLLFFFLIELN
ncbi:hypothetical protein T439DRAFT_196235 [Meredithblackwellia eburnea MCA 4105]